MPPNMHIDIWQGSEHVRGIKYVKVYNMSRYSYNNIIIIIIIITNVIILEFLSPRFVNPVAPQLTILSF